MSFRSVQHIDVLLSYDSLTVFVRECIVVNERWIERELKRFVVVITAAFNQSNHSITSHFVVQNRFLLFNRLQIIEFDANLSFVVWNILCTSFHITLHSDELTVFHASLAFHSYLTADNLDALPALMIIDFGFLLLPLVSSWFLWCWCLLLVNILILLNILIGLVLAKSATCDPEQSQLLLTF